MKKSLLATVAAVALFAGTGFAAAEGATKEQPGMKAGADVKGQADVQKSGNAKAGTEMKADTKAKAGTEMKADTKVKPQATGAAETKAGADVKADTKAKAATEGKDQKAGDTKARTKSQTTGQGSQGQMDPKSQQSAPSQQGTQAPAQRSQTPAQRSGQGAQAPAAQGQTTTNTNVSVNLTPEQKSRIRTTVIQSSNAPRVSNVNFSISVGTVVPRSVKVVAVPSTLVEIHPAWRGYMYFIVGDEIIIVEPRTLKIVAVLDV